jgi:hypothetical protein
MRLPKIRRFRLIRIGAEGVILTRSRVKTRKTLMKLAGSAADTLSRVPEDRAMVADPGHARYGWNRAT